MKNIEERDILKLFWLTTLVGRPRNSSNSMTVKLFTKWLPSAPLLDMTTGFVILVAKVYSLGGGVVWEFVLDAWLLPKIV